MASPNSKLAKKGKAAKKESNNRLPSSSPNLSTKSFDPSQSPSSSCPSVGPPSPPSAPPGLPPLVPTYSLADLAPEQIGWNWETATLGRSGISSTLTATTTDPLDRYLNTPLRYEMIALGLDTSAPVALPHNIQDPASLTDGSAPRPGSPSRPREQDLSSSWSSISTTCSAKGTVGDEDGDGIEPDEAAIRLELCVATRYSTLFKHQGMDTDVNACSAKLNRKRARGKPRIFRQARMKRRDARKRARRVGDSRANLGKGEEALGKQCDEKE
ncbi:hypothetical protein QBC40DRAFT_294316 [Triangularia verruculosa]|uniref:Uncharacterized protein n=1 Tax=Triangularia verruculosa TaxID=2587418 RepID=A0AAN6XLD7_9PEZI|nr:hypothetical protein QBC40DRAFT_294316 [Triangularia verruculosa]